MSFIVEVSVSVLRFRSKQRFCFDENLVVKCTRASNMISTVRTEIQRSHQQVTKVDVPYDF